MLSSADHCVVLVPGGVQVCVSVAFRHSKITPCIWQQVLLHVRVSCMQQSASCAWRRRVYVAQMIGFGASCRVFGTGW
jgi:hypothetical protein